MCTKCGYLDEGKEPRVSVRAMILSVIRFNIDAAEPTHAVERTWTAHRKRNGLDLYGKSAASNSGRAGCIHSQVE